MSDIKSKLSEFSWAILEIVARAPEALFYGFADKNSSNKYLNGDLEFLSDKLIKRLKVLKQKGFVEEVEDKTNPGSRSIVLTEKGKICNIENPYDNKTDGRIRAVSYDIPEKLKGKRQQFCRCLRRIGYIQLQKSLWICKFCKADEIDLLINYLKIDDYVAYFVIEKSNIDRLINQLTEGK